MKRLTFVEVKEALWEQRGLMLTTGIDARHKGKYTYHYPNTGTASISFHTLKEVVEEFKLEV